MNFTHRKDSSLMLSTFRIIFLVLAAVLFLAGSGLIAHRPASAHLTSNTAITETTISTVAGGGFGSDVPAKQAPMVLPSAVALDPLGRGFYVVDEVDGTSLLRFVNTSGNPVILAGVTIQPGNIN